MKNVTAVAGSLTVVPAAWAKGSIPEIPQGHDDPKAETERKVFRAKGGHYSYEEEYFNDSADFVCCSGWEEIPFMALKKGDLFRLQDPNDGGNVFEDGNTIYRAQFDARCDGVPYILYEIVEFGTTKPTSDYQKVIFINN